MAHKPILCDLSSYTYTPLIINTTGKYDRDYYRDLPTYITILKSYLKGAKVADIAYKQRSSVNRIQAILGNLVVIHNKLKYFTTGIDVHLKGIRTLTKGDAAIGQSMLNYLENEMVQQQHDPALWQDKLNIKG